VTLQANEVTGIDSGVSIVGELTGGREFESFTTDADIHKVLKENDAKIIMMK